MNKYTLLQTFGEKGREPRAAEMEGAGVGGVIVFFAAGGQNANKRRHFQG